MISQSCFQCHIWSLKRGTSQSGAKCVPFYHAVARADNHLHLSAASWLALLAQHHDKMSSFKPILLALTPRQQRPHVSKQYLLRLQLQATRSSISLPQLTRCPEWIKTQAIIFHYLYWTFFTSMTRFTKRLKTPIVIG